MVGFNLSNRVAIVTGGGRGIGRAIVLALAREGSNVVIADVISADKVVEEVKAIGRQSLALRIDVTKMDQVQEMVKKAIDIFGRLDILVNNAGVISLHDIVELTEEEWDLIMDVNVKATFLCSKAVVPFMIKQKNGRIINMSSASGREGYAGATHYCASKFAVIGFTQALAKEMAPHNITVNAVCPGIIHTSMWKYLSIEFGKKDGSTPEEAWEKSVRENIPLGRPQTPEDIANMVAYLASPYADNITGQSMSVDGGQVM